MNVQEQILGFLRTSGPTIPSKVAKIIDTDILIASAHLSDLSSQSKVKISHLKIGGTPLYYLPGQEQQLFKFAAGNINPKDMQVLERLREEKILRESELDLLPRVALRSLKDFAIPLNVRTREGSELFWKWHLLSAEKTNARIKEVIIGKKEMPGDFVKPEPKLEEKREEAEKTREPITEAKETEDRNEKRSEEKKVRETEREEKKEIEEEKQEEEESKDQTKTQQKKLLTEKKPPEKKQEVAEIPILSKDKPKRKRRSAIAEEFLPVIKGLCKELKIEIEEEDVVRKNSELNLLVKVPSVVGKMTYFCKAKKKKRCDEKDISAAYMEAQIKKLPLLFLHTNEINKKAKEMLDTGAFENTIVKKIKS